MNDLSGRMLSLVRISAPLMLSAASESLMMFVDRSMLAHHSVDSMNAAAAIMLSSMLFIFSIVAICGISEVLVGNYHGQGESHKAGQPVWQMLRFAVGCSLIAIPVALWGKLFFVPAELIENSGVYFETTMFGAPIWGCVAALSGFFSATGNPKIILIASVIANLTNIILDYVLIFGSGPVPSFGVSGAGIATVLGQLVQLAILGVVFLAPENKLKFGTTNTKWCPQDFRKCLVVGIPGALSHGIEIAAWVLLTHMVASVSKLHLTVMVACQSMMMLFGFLNEGLKQGVVAIAANLLGARNFSEVRTLVRSGVLFHGLLTSALFIPMVVFPTWFLGLLGDVQADFSLVDDLVLALRITWLFLLLDGMVWVLNGVMTSGGDTKALMAINIASTWALAIVPAWIFLVQYPSRPWVVQLFPAIYALGNLILHAMRLSQGKWKRSVTQSETL